MPRITDKEFIQGRLEQDRRWAAYALGDLDEPFCRHASWFCASDGSALTLLYREFATALLFCMDASPAMSEVLCEVDRELGTADLQISCKPELAPLVRSRFPISHERSLIRMALDPDHFSCYGDNDHDNGRHGIVRLGRRQLDDVETLFRDAAPEFFLSWMLDEGVYWGVYERSALIAVAGTHIVSTRRRVACIGNVYTRPDRRARGLSTRVTAALAAELIRMGIDTIVLTVVEGNDPAVRVYERLGFEIHCKYVELFVSPKQKGARSQEPAMPRRAPD